MEVVKKYWPSLFFIPVFLSESLNSFGYFAHSYVPNGKAFPVGALLIIFLIPFIFKSKKFPGGWFLLISIYVIIIYGLNYNIKPYLSLMLFYLAVGLGARLEASQINIKFITLIYLMILANCLIGLILMAEFKYLAGYIFDGFVIYNFEQYFAFSAVLILLLALVEESLFIKAAATINSIGLSLISQNNSALIFVSLILVVYVVIKVLKIFNLSATFYKIIIMMGFISPFIIWTLFIYLSGLSNEAIPHDNGGFEDRAYRLVYFFRSFELGGFLLPYAFFGDYKDIYLTELHGSVLSTISHFGLFIGVAFYCHLYLLLLKISIHSFEKSIFLSLFISVVGLMVEIYYHPFLSIQLGLLFGIFSNKELVKNNFKNRKTPSTLLPIKHI